MEWEPIQGREAFLGRPEGGSKPSIEGRDTLAWAMAELVPKAKPPKKRRWWWPKWMTWKRAVALVVLDIILGNIAWHYLFASHPGDVAKALQSTMSDVSHNHWDDVYNSLCRSDRAQISESELAGAGRAAMASIGFLDHATVTSVTPITRPATETMPSLAPRTPARSQLSRPPRPSDPSCACRRSATSAMQPIVPRGDDGLQRR